MPDLPNLPRKTQARDYPYFRRIWNTVAMTLLAISFLPLVTIGGIIYAYTASVIKETTLASLRTEVLQHKSGIDRFLAERTHNLRIIAENFELAELTRPAVLENVFRTLTQNASCFFDLSIIDHRGHHLAYVGPYRQSPQNDQISEWFVATQEKGSYISDLFLGYRKTPHAIIAVKHPSAGWIIRATIDGAYFEKIVKHISAQKKGDAYLINRAGIYQTTPKTAGRLMGPSGIQVADYYRNVKLEEIDDRIRMTVWLENVPWISVIEIDRKEAYATLYRVRNIVVFIFILSSMIMIPAIVLTNNALVTRLESKRMSIRHLDLQLRQASRIATEAALSTGVFHKVKDSLINIDVVIQWLREFTANQAKTGDAAEAIEKNLKQIDSQTMRARYAIETYLKIADRSDTLIQDIHLHEMLEDLIELLDWETRSKSATVTKDFGQTVAVFRSNYPDIRQVVQSVFFNAIEAVPANGRVDIKTTSDLQGVILTISDNGPGIPEEHLEKVFEPLFTTKNRNSGLGLSVAKALVEKLGGSIAVESKAGNGCRFTLIFPYRFDQNLS